jgi:phage tail-like protein
MQDFDHPVAFQFLVTIENANLPQDLAFAEVSGLDVEIEIETVVEGGENTFVHRLPKGAKHSNLVLKRGIANASNGLAQWCKEVLEGGLVKKIEPRRILVSLCDKENVPLRSWAFSNAYPVKWSTDGLDASKNAIAIETIEFAYHTVKRET